MTDGRKCLECGAEFPNRNLPYPRNALVQALHIARAHDIIGALSDDTARAANRQPPSSTYDRGTRITTYTQGDKSVRIQSFD